MPMKPTEKEKALELRKEGKSYKEIADILGVAKSTVSTIFLRTKKEEKRCLNCGARIKEAQSGRKRIFCSDKCRKSWWRSKSKGKESKCECCGDRFIHHESKRRRFCSFSCYLAYRKGCGSNER